MWGKRLMEVVGMKEISDDYIPLHPFLSDPQKEFCSILEGHQNSSEIVFLFVCFLVKTVWVLTSKFTKNPQLNIIRLKMQLDSH